MDLIDRLELFIRFSILSVTMLYLPTDGPYFQKQIKRINSIVYNDGDEGLRSDESDSCSMVEGSFRDIGLVESDRSDRTRESIADTGSSRYSEEKSDESGNQSTGVPDDSLRSGDAVYQCRF